MPAGALLALFLAVPTIDHQPIGCFQKDRFSRVDAAVEPASQVAEVRLYFRASEEDDFYFSEMALTGGRFEGRLPKPKREEGAVWYFLEAIGADGTVRRTPTMTARVVKSPCATRLAEAVDGDDLRIFSTNRSDAKPRNFAGIARVTQEQPRTAASAPADPVPPKGEARTPTPVPVASTAPTPRATPPPTAGPATFEPAPAPRPAAPELGGDYEIGPEDILRVTVYGHEDLTQAIVVQADGTFTFPLVARNPGAGSSPNELARNPTTALAKGFVRNPQVTVVVQEYRSQSVFVVGEVSRPGTYPLQGRTTVVEILAKAGPTQNAGEEVTVVRPRVAAQGPILPSEVAGEQAEVIRVNVRDIKMGKLDQNVVLRPHDTVFVYAAPKIFVSGEVRNGGAFAYSQGITVRQAISMAGGFTPEASSGRIRVVREVDGKPKEVKIKIDDPVMPGDTVVVKAKRF
jgi:polysaccharide export outer membrane protein